MSYRTYRSTTDGATFVVGLKAGPYDEVGWRLIVVAGSRRTAHPLPDSAVAVGRSSAAGIQVDHPSVSRLQCVIEVQGRRAFVRDCGDEVGVLVEGARVPPYAEVEARSGAAITLSDSVYARLVDYGPGDLAP